MRSVTASLFESSKEEIERQRDVLQVRNAEIILAAREVHKWLRFGPIYTTTNERIVPEGWDDALKLLDEVLK